MEPSPKYSIVVPVYNCGDYLVPCIESILGQSFKDFELVLVDDGSTDGSGEKCDEYALQDARVRVFHKANGGAASARNAGFNRATGEWLLFVDGDDTIEQECLAAVDGVVSETENVDMVTFGMSFDYYSKGKLTRSEILSCKTAGSMSVEEMLEIFSELFADNALSSSCNRVFRWDIVEANNLRYNESMYLYEDLDFVLRYLAVCHSCCFLSEPFYHYRLDISENHYYQKVSCREIALSTVLLLKDTCESLVCKLRQSSNVESTLYELSKQILSLHLLLSPCTENEINDIALEMGETNDYWVRRGLVGGNDVFARINQKEYASLVKEYRRKHTKLLVKQRTKRILSGLGIRR